MKFLRNLLIIAAVIAALIVGAYLVAWVFLVLIIAAPIAYLWWRWKVRKLKQRLHREGVVIDIHQMH